MPNISCYPEAIFLQFCASQSHKKTKKNMDPGNLLNIMSGIHWKKHPREHTLWQEPFGILGKGGYCSSHRRWPRRARQPGAVPHRFAVGHAHHDAGGAILNFFQRRLRSVRHRTKHHVRKRTKIKCIHLYCILARRPPSLTIRSSNSEFTCNRFLFSNFSLSAWWYLIVGSPDGI